MHIYVMYIYIYIHIREYRAYTSFICVRIYIYIYIYILEKAYMYCFYHMVYTVADATAPYSKHHVNYIDICVQCSLPAIHTIHNPKTTLFVPCALQVPTWYTWDAYAEASL